MRAAVFVPTWFAIGALSASLADIEGVLSFPLSWTEQTIPYQTSSTCVANIEKTSWIVGGKAKGVVNDISNMAQKMQFTTSDYNWELRDEIMQLPGSFPGQFLNSPGIYCATGSGVYGTFNDSLKQFCYLSGNDGTSNTPQCGCCSVEGTSNTHIRCRDLDKTDMCPPLFGSCIINDNANNRGLQIGGSSGVDSAKNILCFDMNNETFTKPVNTFDALQTELNTYDDQCEYGSLVIATAEAACGLMRNDAYHSIIVVGGYNETHYLKSIQVCKNDHQDCQNLPNLELPVPLSGAQVVGLSDCIFLVAGGLNANGAENGMIYVGDICGQQWLHNESMPAALAEFSIVTGIDSLCFYGGINRDQLLNVTYCTNYYPDAYKSNDTDSSSKKKKMPAGTIVGIVLGIFFAVVLIVGIAWCYKDRENKEGAWNKFLTKSRSLMSSFRTTHTNESEKTMTDIATDHTEQTSTQKVTNVSTGNTTSSENTTSSGDAASSEKATTAKNTTSAKNTIPAKNTTPAKNSTPADTTSAGHVQVTIDNKKTSK